MVIALPRVSRLSTQFVVTVDPFTFRTVSVIKLTPSQCALQMIEVPELPVVVVSEPSSLQRSLSLAINGLSLALVLVSILISVGVCEIIRVIGPTGGA